MGSTRQALGSSKSHTAADATRIAAHAAASTAAHIATTPLARAAHHTTTLLPTLTGAINRAAHARTVRFLRSTTYFQHDQTSRPGPSPDRLSVASSP